VLTEFKSLALARMDLQQHTTPVVASVDVLTRQLATTMLMLFLISTTALALALLKVNATVTATLKTLWVCAEVHVLQMQMLMASVTM
tara:strand:- start:3293 stop:3553 length:261 start_codon:yes stop_codon:yes gene_type:complete